LAISIQTITVSECCLTKLLPYKMCLHLYFTTGNGQTREPALCQLYRHTFISYRPRGNVVYTVYSCNASSWIDTVLLCMSLKPCSRHMNLWSYVQQLVFASQYVFACAHYRPNNDKSRPPIFSIYHYFFILFMLSSCRGYWYLVSYLLHCMPCILLRCKWPLGPFAFKKLIDWNESNSSLERVFFSVQGTRAGFRGGLGSCPGASTTKGPLQKQWKIII